MDTAQRTPDIRAQTLAIVAQRLGSYPDLEAPLRALSTPDFCNLLIDLELAFGIDLDVDETHDFSLDDLLMLVQARAIVSRRARPRRAAASRVIAGPWPQRGAPADAAPTPSAAPPRLSRPARRAWHARSSPLRQLAELAVIAVAAGLVAGAAFFLAEPTGPAPTLYSPWSLLH
jgi:hypothetical protein